MCVGEAVSMCASMTLEPASVLAFGLPFLHPATSSQLLLSQGEENTV
jgi:hypothetical protein